MKTKGWYEAKNSVYWHYSADGKKPICDKTLPLGKRWNQKFWMLYTCLKCLKHWSKKNEM